MPAPLQHHAAQGPLLRRPLPTPSGGQAASLSPQLAHPTLGHSSCGFFRPTDLGRTPLNACRPTPVQRARADSATTCRAGQMVGVTSKTRSQEAQQPAPHRRHHWRRGPGGGHQAARTLDPHWGEAPSQPPADARSAASRGTRSLDRPDSWPSETVCRVRLSWGSCDYRARENSAV